MKNLILLLALVLVGCMEQPVRVPAGWDREARELCAGSGGIATIEIRYMIRTTELIENRNYVFEHSQVTGKCANGLRFNYELRTKITGWEYADEMPRL